MTGVEWASVPELAVQRIFSPVAGSNRSGRPRSGEIMLRVQALPSWGGGRLRRVTRGGTVPDKAQGQEQGETPVPEAMAHRRCVHPGARARRESRVHRPGRLRRADDGWARSVPTSASAVRFMDGKTSMGSDVRLGTSDSAGRSVSFGWSDRGLAGKGSPMSFADQVRCAGVVGAGGAGFPRTSNSRREADIVIANGAECEPLLHKDAAVMEHFAQRVVTGVRLAMEAVGAGDGVVAIKAKNQHAVRRRGGRLPRHAVRVKLLGDYYRRATSTTWVHEVTGRLIPPAGIPLARGCVVNNVETLANMPPAAEGRPLTRKTLTVAGRFARR